MKSVKPFMANLPVDGCASIFAKKERSVKWTCGNPQIRWFGKNLDRDLIHYERAPRWIGVHRTAIASNFQTTLIQVVFALANPSAVTTLG
jgi:hypothetical protein